VVASVVYRVGLFAVFDHTPTLYTKNGQEDKDQAEPRPDGTGFSWAIKNPPMNGGFKIYLF